MSLIDKEKLEREMYHNAFEIDTDLQKWDSGCWIRYKMFENVIEKQPTVDAEPVRHGKFVGTEYDGYADGYPVYYEWECSQCGCVFEDEKPTYKYCPNCGAKMDLEKENDNKN